MLVMTSQGLYCRAGNFYVDPRGKVENAVITHAHSDHARRGSQHYYCTDSGMELLKCRIGKKISVTSYPYQTQFTLGDAIVSFHPAGHILGSSQVRIEVNGMVWVASGDYKREPDPTCAPFETVPCDVFITEATFGTPAFCWPRNVDLGKEIFEWWQANAAAGFNSVICAYSLGKTQRILGLLKEYARAGIYCHPAAKELNQCYLNSGVELAPALCISDVKKEEVLSGALIITPSAFLRSEQVAILGENYKTAFASGWMANTNFGYDHGFLISDHADWNDLLTTVLESKARHVYVQHRGKGALVRKLRSLGIKAYSEAALYPVHADQMSFF
jgi:putative mRNA 3-end processing factor